jgi:AcrR family transcriptional regulator
MTTKQTILQAALDLASTHPGRYDRLTRSEIAKRANCATGSINYYFTDMAGLRDAVVEAAVATSAHRVVAAAIMDGHPAVAGLTGAERAEALAGV